MDENTLYLAYRDATGAEKEQLELELIRLLRKHAHALVYLKLKEHREDLVNYAVWLAIRDHMSFEGRNDARFTTWFHHVVMNVCNAALRAKQRQREVPLDDVTEPSADRTTDIDQQIELERLVGDLSETDKILVRLKLTGADSEEIAEQLGVAPSTVRVKFSRLKEKLQTVGKG